MPAAVKVSGDYLDAKRQVLAATCLPRHDPVGAQAMPTFSLKDILDALGSAWPVALTALLGSAAVLVSAHFDVSYATMLPGWVLATFFVTATFSAGLCATKILQAGIAGISYSRRFYRIRQHRARQLAWLRNLPERDHELMSYLFTEKMQAFPYLHGESRFVPLVVKGLVVIQPGQHYVDSWPHLIPDHVWEAMEAEPAKFRFDKRKENPLRWMG